MSKCWGGGEVCVVGVDVVNGDPTIFISPLELT